ncbi:glycosyltransferase family 2 protein [Acuticoccus kandeliae]|uniref:glycosyltransferase family 2 protein n=1 Tax=Acuticoccus kandeliae TaxID=2073160 RepID=UPI000D3E2158|nr:glycosyltransferase family 2 protein [Acuticoccus kandeliae]
MTSVDVCVCTFRRASIRATLQSLAAQTLPEGVRLAVIVADNDETDAARAAIEAAGAEFGLALTYRHAPARNISIARNATLDAATAEFVAILDDDEIAAPDWIAALLARQAESGADVVLGPVVALYDAAAPAWMRDGDFHSAGPVHVNGTIRTGYTSNVLFRREAAPLAGARFRLDLGQTGGEDTEFFSRAFRAGARLVEAPGAIVREHVDARRQSLGWLMKRRFRSGQTHGLLLAQGAAGAAGHPKAIAVAGAKFGVCAVAAAATLPLARRRAFWMLRAALHAGVVSQLLGMRTLVQYGADQPLATR